VVAMVVLFRKPLMEFASWLWEWGAPIREFWVGLWSGAKDAAIAVFSTMGGLLNQYLLQPWIRMGQALVQASAATWEAVKQPILAFFSWWTTTLYQVYVEPFVRLWSVLQGAASAFFSWFRSAAVPALAQPFMEARAAAIQAWQGIVEQLSGVLQGIGTAFRQNVVEPVQTAWSGIVEFMSGVVQNAASALQGAYRAIASGVIGAFQSVVNTVGRVVNQIINAINTLLNGINKVRAAAGLSAINVIPQWNIPSFAEGGVVMRPTLALVGEGGEREYIIPESKMGRASENYLAGQRGDAVLAAQRFQMATATGGGGITVAPGRSPINITTGPVQQIDGRRYATLDDLEAVAQEVATQIYGTLRTPAGRRAIGVI
jgi:hypothetical protein